MNISYFAHLHIAYQTQWRRRISFKSSSHPLDFRFSQCISHINIMWIQICTRAHTHAYMHVMEAITKIVVFTHTGAGTMYTRMYISFGIVESKHFEVCSSLPFYWSYLSNRQPAQCTHSVHLLCTHTHTQYAIK